MTITTMAKTHVWITVQKAARQLGVTPAAVYAAIEGRPLRKNTEWGRVLVMQEEIDAWHKERQEGARAVLSR